MADRQAPAGSSLRRNRKLGIRRSALLQLTTPTVVLPVVTARAAEPTPRRGRAPSCQAMFGRVHRICSRPSNCAVFAAQRPRTRLRLRRIVTGLCRNDNVPWRGDRGVQLAAIDRQRFRRRRHSAGRTGHHRSVRQHRGVDGCIRPNGALFKTALSGGSRSLSAQRQFAPETSVYTWLRVGEYDQDFSNRLTVSAPFAAAQRQQLTRTIPILVAEVAAFFPRKRRRVDSLTAHLKRLGPARR